MAIPFLRSHNITVQLHFQFHSISACLPLGMTPCFRTWMSTTALKQVSKGLCTMETYSVSAKPFVLRLMWVLVAILLQQMHQACPSSTHPDKLLLKSLTWARPHPAAHTVVGGIRLPGCSVNVYREQEWVECHRFLGRYDFLIVWLLWTCLHAIFPQ